MADVGARLAVNPMPSGRLLPEASPPAAEMGVLIVENLHRLNVLATCRALEKGGKTRPSDTDGC
jgi:hypothetical protein